MGEITESPYVIMREEIYAQIVDEVRRKTGLTRKLVARDLYEAIRKIEIDSFPKVYADCEMAIISIQETSVSANITIDSSMYHADCEMAISQ